MVCGKQRNDIQDGGAYRARFIQIFVTRRVVGRSSPPRSLLRRDFSPLSRFLPFHGALFHSPGPRVSYFFNLLFFFYFPPPNPVRKYAGNTKDLFTCGGREKGRTCHGKAGEESAGADKDAHKGDKDCLFGPADDCRGTVLLLFFFPFFLFSLLSYFPSFRSFRSALVDETPFLSFCPARRSVSSFSTRFFRHAPPAENFHARPVLFFSFFFFLTFSFAEFARRSHGSRSEARTSRRFSLGKRSTVVARRVHDFGKASGSERWFSSRNCFRGR